MRGGREHRLTNRAAAHRCRTELGSGPLGTCHASRAVTRHRSEAPVAHAVPNEYHFTGLNALAGSRISRLFPRDVQRAAGRSAVWLARLLWEQEVESSNLSAPTVCKFLLSRNLRLPARPAAQRETWFTTTLLPQRETLPCRPNETCLSAGQAHGPGPGAFSQTRDRLEQVRVPGIPGPLRRSPRGAVRRE